MCSDLFLSFLYFGILFVVNFFLFFLTKNVFFDIVFLFKIKRILKYFQRKKKIFISFLYFFQKTSSSNQINSFVFFSKRLKLEKINDMLIIKNFLLFLSKKKIFSTQFYLNLLKIQYNTF
jgi:hypothetical protein